MSDPSSLERAADRASDIYWRGATGNFMGNLIKDSGKALAGTKTGAKAISKVAGTKPVRAVLSKMAPAIAKIAPAAKGVSSATAAIASKAFGPVGMLTAVAAPILISAGSSLYKKNKQKKDYKDFVKRMENLHPGWRDLPEVKEILSSK
jgi:hypothetical protein